MVGHRLVVVQFVIGACDGHAVERELAQHMQRTDRPAYVELLHAIAQRAVFRFDVIQSRHTFRHVVVRKLREHERVGLTEGKLAEIARLRTRVIDDVAHCTPLSQPSTFRIPLCFHNYASAPHHPTSANGDASGSSAPRCPPLPFLCVICAALMCHNSIFHAFSRIVTHESAEMRLGNHPDQPLHPPIAPPRHALQPASALNPLQPSRTAFAALTGIALITALMSPRVSRSVLRAASTIFGSESVQCSTKSAILPYPAAAKIP